MRKKLYLVRHCEAEGQAFGADLTKVGHRQALELEEFFSDVGIEKIVSSPFKRAVDSIYPLATTRNLEIQIDKRLSERVLSTMDLPDWQDKLKKTFTDLDMIYDGGESSRQAMERTIELVNEQMLGKEQKILFVTHGNLLALLIKYYQPNFGFEEWGKLSNPDVYLLEMNQMTVAINRIWK